MRGWNRTIVDMDYIVLIMRLADKESGVALKTKLEEGWDIWRADQCGECLVYILERLKQ